MDLFSKKDPTRDEYIIAHSLTMLGMKKIGQEKVDKIVKSDDIKYVTAYPRYMLKRSNKIGVTGLSPTCLTPMYLVVGQLSEPVPVFCYLPVNTANRQLFVL